MHVQIEQSHDMAFMTRMVNHPSIYPFIRDDSITGHVDCCVLNDSNSRSLRVMVDGQEAGFALLMRQGDGYELHSGLLPGFRGRIAIEAGKAVIDWVTKHNLCDRLTTWAWANARHVLLVTRILGFKEESRDDWPNPVNGQRVQRILFSLSINHS